MIEDHRPPEGWPASGAISVEQLSMRYREELPTVLNEVSCEIAAGENVGVCGRTGSGKSSMMLSLFRCRTEGEGAQHVHA